jgi:hypothetical protein
MVACRCVLDQPHLIEQAAQVALLLGAQRAEAHPGAQAGQPAIDAGLQALVDAKRVPDHVAAVQQARHLRIEFGHGERGVHAQPCARRIGRPRRYPSQISRSRSLGWQNSVVLPSPVMTSQACGSVKPLR